MHCCSVCRANAGTASAEPNRTHANRPMRSAIPPARLNTRSNTMPPASEFAFEKIETHVQQQCVGRYLFRGFARSSQTAMQNAPASRRQKLRCVSKRESECDRRAMREFPVERRCLLL